MRIDYYKEYKDSLNDLLAFMTGIKSFLFEQLKAEFKDFSPQIESRLKALQSLEFKIDQSYPIPKSILEINDLIGLRIICISESQQSLVLELVGKFLTISKYKDSFTELDEDQFGYTSKHIICEIDDDIVTKINYNGNKNLIGQKFEIQTRTFAQHIFSQLSHKYNYKSAKYIPDKIKRPLYRIAALSELIDQEINNFEKTREEFINGYVAQEDGSELNTNSLKLYCQSKLDEFRNLGEQEDYLSLVRDLSYFGVKRISELNELIQKNIALFNQYEGNIIKQMKELPPTERDIFRNHIENNFLYSYSGLIRGILREEFKGAYLDYKTDVIDKETWSQFNQMLDEFTEEEE